METDLILENQYKVMNNQEENAEILRKKLAELSQKLDVIKMLAGKEQGRWVNLDLEEAPDWTMPFKKIVQIIEN